MEVDSCQIFLFLGIFFIPQTSCEEASLYPNGALPPETECTRKCTLNDKDLDVCWAQSLDHYTEKLADAVSSYAGTLLYLHRWRQRQAHSSTEAQFEQLALEKFIGGYNTSFHNEDAEGFRIDPALLKGIMKEVIDNAKSVYEEEYTDETDLLPNFACPTPCNADLFLWKVLFFVMLSILVLAVLSFYAYFYTHRQHLSTWRYKDKMLVPDKEINERY